MTNAGLIAEARQLIAEVRGPLLDSGFGYSQVLDKFYVSDAQSRRWEQPESLVNAQVAANELWETATRLANALEKAEAKCAAWDEFRARLVEEDSQPDAFSDRIGEILELMDELLVRHQQGESK